MTGDVLRPAAAALACHLALVGLVDLCGLGDVRWASARAVALPVAAALVVLVVQRSGAGLPVPAIVGLAWLVVGLVHHYVVGLTPRWDGDGVRGGAHVLWDLAFHLPPLALAAFGPATRRPA